jgi:radical SAM protein with 4Fe4S-binding SPASM domain
MNILLLERIKRRALVTGFTTMRRLGKTPPPKTVIWECTLDCNMRCIHCGSGGEGSVRDELSTGEISGIVADLAHLGVVRFLATGGEPLLRPDLLDVLQEAKNRGLETGFSTNGSLVSEGNIGKIVRVADSIQVSVDGIGETHDSMRRARGSFEGAIHALRLLKEHRCTQACMTTIVTPQNLSELEDLYRLAHKHADLWRVGTVMPIGRASSNGSLFLSNAQLTTLLDFMAGKAKDSFPVLIGENLGYLGNRYDGEIHRHDFFFCGIGFTSCCIGMDGRVRGCPELPPIQEFIAGSLRNGSFQELWEKGFESYRDEGCSHVPDECRECTDLELCRGGCQVMRLKGLHCTKKLVGPSGS